MAAVAYTFPAPPRQYNFLTESYEAAGGPEQMRIEFPEVETDSRWTGHVALLATENGAQFYCAGFGIFLGKKSERLTVKQQGKTIGEIPLFKLQEIVIASRGVSLSVDLIEAACERGVRIALLGGSGRPFGLITSPMLTATVETRKAQIAALGQERGAGLSRMLVAGKLRNQEKLLRYFARNRDQDRQARILAAAKQMRGLRAKALAHPGVSCDE